MRKLEIDEIKKIELEILKTISEFCDSNHLKYYLTYGTLLGAVRHKGFIPWDDDIDINMPRNDYDRLQTLLKNQHFLFNEYTELKTPDSKSYQYQFLKVFDNRTIVYEKNMKKKYKASVWIDIFPLDKLPEEKKKQNAFMSKLLKMRKYYFYTIEKKFSGNSTFGNIKYSIIKFIMTPIYFLINQKKRIAKYARKYINKNTKYVFFSLNGDSYKTIFEDNILEQTDIIFEDYKFTTFKNYDKVLTQLYGDYMQLPPPEKRVLAHSLTAYWK